MVAFEQREGSAEKSERWRQGGNDQSRPSTSSSYGPLTFFDIFGLAQNGSSSYLQYLEQVNENRVSASELIETTPITQNLSEIYSPHAPVSQLAMQDHLQQPSTNSPLTTGYPILSSSSPSQYYTPKQTIHGHITPILNPSYEINTAPAF